MIRQHRGRAGNESALAGITGATNRVDALDAALRRPGRFDRELVFPLPSLAARAAILDIHTRHWADPPTAQLREHLAQLSVGYCGADLKVTHFLFMSGEKNRTVLTEVSVKILCSFDLEQR